MCANKLNTPKRAKLILSHQAIRRVYGSFVYNLKRRWLIIGLKLCYLRNKLLIFGLKLRYRRNQLLIFCFELRSSFWVFLIRFYLVLYRVKCAACLHGFGGLNAFKKVVERGELFSKIHKLKNRP